MIIKYPAFVKEFLNSRQRSYHTTLTQLISTFLEQLPAGSELLEDAPVVRRLTGSLSPDISIEDYRKHLDKKYGG